MPSKYQNTGPVDCSRTTNVENLASKTVLVTGGSSGLGLAIVTAFAKAGATVIAADIKSLPQDLNYTNIHYVKCDTTCWEDQLAAFRFAQSVSPTKLIDTVMANAGISGDDPFFMGIDDEDLTEPNIDILKVNLVGTFYTARLATHFFNKQAKSNEEKDRCLVMTSSIMGYLDSRPSYGSTKFGVRAMMRSLRHQPSFRTNLIAPWFIHTPIMSGEVASKLGSQLHAQGTDFALVEDCTDCVLRIASDDSIDGRGIAVLPRQFAKDGFMDLNQDDFEPGTLCAQLQSITRQLSHRR